MRHFFYILFILLSVQAFGQSADGPSVKERYKKAIIENDISTQNTLSKQLKSEYSTNELNYYKRLLSNTPSHSMLITNGLEDTYPILILQHTESVGKNVEVVSLKLLNEEKYLYRVFDNLKLSKEFDKTGTSVYMSQLLLAHKKIFISNTVNPSYYSNYSSKLYVVGLALEYQSQNQLNQLELFWTNLQKKNTYKFKLTNTEKGIYSNYLPPLLTLYKLKVESGVKDEGLKLGILYIGQLLDKSTTVKNIIKQYEKGG